MKRRSMDTSSSRFFNLIEGTEEDKKWKKTEKYRDFFY